MTKMFKKLRVGEKFYPPRDDGTMDLRLAEIKVSAIHLVESGPWPNLKVTPNVVKHGHINAVITHSPNGTDGFYDFIPDETMVYPENAQC